ncbi:MULTISPECIES: hypothetical protein [Rhizobium/Agrobacterium group]|uniref:hypothetical protein n=1 Tax=Rhizobium/Agrobacterium group TaxID=227290 RepID=UPI0010D52863|nr:MULTISPECIES: hypothetical protein [Rhizobium/Agrobacterium group]TCR91745.1 hypothetical protein EV561_102189 [Rhizobium sp. BK376]
MLARNLSCLAFAVTVLCCTVIGASAQEANVKPHIPLQKTIGQVTPTGPVPSLAVINSAGATLENGKLTLTGVSASSIVFADRPVRAAGHVTTEQFIMQWDEGKNNFARNPPNATVSVLGGDGSQVADAVVTLRSPKLDNNTLTFDVSVLEGSLTGLSGPAAVFIDNFDSGYGGDSRDYAAGNDGKGNYWHAPVYHGAWYRSSLPSIASEAESSTVPPPYYSNYYHNNCVDEPFELCY